ncbi:hypothetical protein ACU8KH_04829 [Lachancea thermotolerans]
MTYRMYIYTGLGAREPVSRSTVVKRKSVTLQRQYQLEYPLACPPEHLRQSSAAVSWDFEVESSHVQPPQGIHQIARFERF